MPLQIFSSVYNLVFALPLVVPVFVWWFGSREPNALAPIGRGSQLAKVSQRSWVKQALEKQSHAHDCVLFNYVAKLQGDKGWGRLLDAGTGSHSLSWALSQETRCVVAVTGAKARQRDMQEEFGSELRRDVDRVVLGNWGQPEFLRGELFDVVLADYLLGSLDGFAPFFQDKLFDRLREHVAPGGSLYIVGMQPLPDNHESVAGKLLIDIKRARDACILLSSDMRRPYREYPLSWTLRHLRAAGFKVKGVGEFSITFTQSFVNRQIAVGERKIPYMDPSLQVGMKRTLANLRTRVKNVDWSKVTEFKDYVIGATLEDKTGEVSSE